MSAMRFSPLHKKNDDVATEGGRPAGDPRDEELREGGTRYRGRPAAGPGIEKRRIAPGGPQIGSGLCGFLAALGSYVVITAVVHAVVIRANTGHNIANALDGARSTQPTTVAWSGAISLLVLAFVACLIGGYACGTMARKHGLVEGVSVWLWAAVAAVVASLIVELSSTKYAALYQFDIFPRIRVGSWHSNSAVIVTAIVIAAAGLFGAVLGALVGAAAHRRVRVLETDAVFRSRA